MESRAVMERLYADVKPKTRQRRQLRVPSLGLRKFSFRGWLRKMRKAIIPVACLVAYASTHLYYYNTLIDLEYNCDAAWAQVQTQRQRRYNIQKNLTKIAMDYAAHEREVLVAVTKVRAVGDPGSASDTAAQPGAGDEASESGGEEETPARTPAEAADEDRARQAQYESLFSKLQLVAEQYPQLMLSKNLGHFAEAVVATEGAIADKTMEYNEAVNVYSTMLKSFPAAIFGWACGFRTREYYRPSADTVRFSRVEY